MAELSSKHGQVTSGNISYLQKSYRIVYIFAKLTMLQQE